VSQTLDRALSILEFVAESPRRINEVAEHLGVHHSTALRLLHTLRGHGYVVELPDHAYRVGPATFRLGFTALERIPLRAIARPYMQQLNRETGETIHLGTLENGEVVYIEKVEARHRVRMHSSIGGIAGLHSTGVGKAILAFLSEEEQDRLLADYPLKRHTATTITSREELKADLAATRERCYAINDGELEEGIGGVACPILRPDGTVAGGLSIVAPATRFDRDALEDLAPRVIDAARGVSEELGKRST
jgi:DNA-binding IclR family transcriptional regulator